MQVHELWSVYTGQRFITMLDEKGDLRNSQGVIMGRQSDPDSDHTDDRLYQCIVREATHDEEVTFGLTPANEDNTQRTNRIPSGGNPPNRHSLTRRRPPQAIRATPHFARR